MKHTILLALLVLISSCSGPHIQVDLSCYTCVKSQRLSCEGNDCPSTFMSGSDCLVTIIETGEILNLNPLLKLEGLEPTEGIPVAIAKLKGRYYLSGEGFRNLWVISRTGDGEAEIEGIAIPSGPIKIPVFEIYQNQLLIGSSNFDGKFILNDDTLIKMK